MNDTVRCLDCGANLGAFTVSHRCAPCNRARCEARESAAPRKNYEYMSPAEISARRAVEDRLDAKRLARELNGLEWLLED